MSKERKKAKKIILTEKQYNKLISDVRRKSTLDASNMAIYIFLAWLKDEKLVDNDGEKLVETYRHLESWIKAIENHLIDVGDIQKIIEDATGMKMYFTNGPTRCIKGVSNDG